VSETSCIFCKIVVGELPADVLRETDRVIAFRDIDPKAPTHILLIPKEHVAASAADVEDRHADLLADIVQSAAHLARTEGLADGWRLVTNVGPHAGQTVFHLHFHLLGGRPMPSMTG
jgi:histidine triad (HIT) family protein